MSTHIKDSAAEHLYRKLVWEKDLIAAVRAIDSANLRNLGRWLEETRVEGGVPALISGLVAAEAAERFFTQDNFS